MPLALSNFIELEEEFTHRHPYSLRRHGDMVWQLTSRETCTVDSGESCEYDITGSDECEGDDATREWLGKAMALAETDQSMHIFGIA